MERAEADVFILWDFNALSYRAAANAGALHGAHPKRWLHHQRLPTLIPRTAPRPQAAMMACEFISSATRASC